jgi:hypothetical protein
MKYKVIGPLRVNGVSTGDVVDLDPANINIPILVAAGHIDPEPVAEPESAVVEPAKAPTSKKG